MGASVEAADLGTMQSMTRDPWLDNIKMTLVTLVVIGHSWGLLAATPLDLRLYDFLYYWHIPAFVLITGHLSRSFEWDRRHFSSLFTTVVLPYLIFEFALFHFRSALGQHEDGPVWLQPHWGMWYLCVLFFWRLATPLLRKHWAAIPVAVGISLLGGLYDELWFGIPRILGLLPFFVIGLHLDRRHLAHLRASWLKPLAVLALGWILVFSGHTDAWARSAFLYYDAPYSDLGFPAVDSMQIRLTVMAIGLLGTASVLALIPGEGVLAQPDGQPDARGLPVPRLLRPLRRVRRLVRLVAGARRTRPRRGDPARRGPGPVPRLAAGRFPPGLAGGSCRVRPPQSNTVAA